MLSVRQVFFHSVQMEEIYNFDFLSAQNRKCLSCSTKTNGIACAESPIRQETCEMGYDYCYIKIVDKYHIERACGREHDCLWDTGQCFKCNYADNCNHIKFIIEHCHNSTFDANNSVKCPIAPMGVDRTGCYDMFNSNPRQKGCIGDLSRIDKVNCVFDESVCKICYGDNCNNVD